MERPVVVAIAEGLHARPAALFVAEAGKQPVPVTVRKGENEPVQAASILGIMTLGAAAGDTVVLATEADGAPPPPRGAGGPVASGDRSAPAPSGTQVPVRPLRAPGKRFPARAARKPGTEVPDHVGTEVPLSRFSRSPTVIPVSLARR
jgi:phosphocarrier protein